MAAMLENSSMADILSLLLETPDKISLDIAITGESGAGKSAFVNALRGLHDEEEGAAPIGIIETTMRTVPYEHPKHPNVTIWDLPGIGTPQFSAATYLQQVEFDRYDFFVIVTAGAFRQNHILLAKAISDRGKNFYFVRTKIELDLENARRQKGSYYREANVLQDLKQKYKQHLQAEGFTSPKVFLLSRYELNKYDFHQFEETLENDLPVHKRHAFILALPTISSQILKKKKDILKKHVWEVATAACGITAIPTPGLPFPCDSSILLASMLNYYKEFGLDDESLSRLAQLVDLPEADLRIKMMSPPSSDLSANQVGRLLTEAQGGFFSNIAQFFLSPFGAPAAGRKAFVAMLRMLGRFVDLLEEDAQRILSRAVGKKNT